MKFTDASVATLKLPKNSLDAIFYDETTPGFAVRIRAGGTRKFIVQYQFGGKQRRDPLGLVGVRSVEEARKDAQVKLEHVRGQRDPRVIEEQERKAAEAKAAEQAAEVAAGVPFSQVMEDYLRFRQRDMRARSYEETARHLRTHWSTLHGLAAAKVDRKTVAAKLRTIVDSNGPVAANRARASLSSMYAWAIGEGLCDANPVVGTNKQAEEERDRVLSDEELAKIWIAAPDNDYGRIVRLLILTGQRRDEVGGLRVNEIRHADDSGRALIALPSTRTKNHTAHDVPLSKAALAVLRDQPRVAGRDVLFGGGDSGFSNWSKSKTALDTVSGVTGWRLHDLRRTARTGMGALGVLPHVAEAVLNHLPPKLVRTYDKNAYMAEKRDALDRWAGHVALIVAQATGANVVSIKGVAPATR